MSRSVVVQEDLRAIADIIRSRAQRLAGKNLLVTGGTGFLGTYLLETVAYLNETVLAEPCRLYAITRDPRRFAERVPHVAARPEITLVEGDVRHLSLPPVPWHFIVHAAASSDARQFLQDPVGTAETIVQGTRAVLDAARGSCTEAVLFVSTGAVYGEQPPECLWLSEQGCGGPDIRDPRSCYAEAKRYAELLCRLYRTQHGVPSTIARVFALVGPYQDLNSTSAIVDFIRQALDGDTIRIRDDGRAVRSYCYIADAVAALWRLLLRDGAGEVANVGSDREAVSFVDLAERIGRCLGKSVTVTTAGAPPAGVLGRRYAPDVSYLATLEGFRPATSLDDALGRTIAWFKERHAVGPAPAYPR